MYLCECVCVGGAIAVIRSPSVLCDSVSLEAELTLLTSAATGHSGQFHIELIWSVCVCSEC